MSEHDHTSSATPIASFEELTAKPRRKLDFTVQLLDGDGKPVGRRMVFEALSATEYDDLVQAHPPTPRQLQEAGGAGGVSYNLDTFAPALISAVSSEPKLSYEQAETLYKDPKWSGGEISTLFFNAQRVCNSGLDVPFSARG